MRLGGVVRRVVLFSFGTIALAATLGPMTLRDNTGFNFYSYMFEIGGERQIVSALQGGFVDGIVSSETGPDGSVNKHISGQAVEPLRVRMKFNQFTTFLVQSINSAGSPQPTDGKIYYVDESMQFKFQ